MDAHGHIFIRPKELLEIAFADPARLVNDILIPGTPHVFPTYEGYCAFLRWLANTLCVNPRCVAMRGSCKLGFSIAPWPEKVWGECHDGSDLDLGIVDPDYYHTIDRETRHWERQPETMAAIVQSDVLSKQWKRRQNERQYYYYRDYNLPDGLQCKQLIANCTQAAPVGEACGINRPVNIFVYRDWLSLVARYEFDLQELTEKVGREEIPKAEFHLRPAGLTGNWETWHSNGQRAWECAYLDGSAHGLWRSWYKEGQPRFEGNFQGGIRAGQWRYLGEDGAIQTDGVYENNRPRNGTFKEWHAGRQCYVLATYNHGKRHHNLPKI
jgi:hypothetical protein